MELADVEAWAEGRFGALAELLDLQFPEFVRERLGRPGDVAVHFGRHLVDRQRGARGHVVDGLLARPAHRVNARVDDEAARAPHLVSEPAEVVVRIGVEAGLEAEPFGVEPPAFAERRDVREAAEVRQVLQLAAEGDLQMMSRHRLVQRERLEVVQRTGLELVRVHPVNAGLRASLGRVDVAAGRVLRRDVGRHGVDRVRQAREGLEERRQLPVHALGDA